MKKALIMLVTVLLAGTGNVLSAPPDEEMLHYEWKLRGAAVLLRLVGFPTSGVGSISTTAGAKEVASRMRIDSERPDVYYLYESTMSGSGERTLTSGSGYRFGNRHRTERAHFDYENNVVHVSKTSEDDSSRRERPLPRDSARDVLTSIWYLRHEAGSIGKPARASVYSSGKPYEVVFTPLGIEILEIAGRRIAANGFRIHAAPGAKEEMRGDVTVWISDDARRLPLRIGLDQELGRIEMEMSRIPEETVAIRFE